MALRAGIDVLHHAHGISAEQIDIAVRQGVKVVATPMGGTHLPPNSPEDILRLAEKNISIPISTDSYLPPYPNVSWMPFEDRTLKGPDALMLIAHPSMQLLKKHNFNENGILGMLTANPAHILGKSHLYGRLEPGLEANFLIADGIPGLEITEAAKIKKVFYQGKKVIERV